MKTIRTHCLCLCHTRLHGLSSDGTVQPCAIKQLFPVHQLRLVTLNENIFAWFPWLQRGEKWLPSQPSGSPFIHTHIIYFWRFLEGPSCTEWKCKKRSCVDSRGFEPFVIVSPAVSPWQPGMEILKYYFCSFFLSWIFIIVTLKAQNKLVLDIKFHFLYRWIIPKAYERHSEVCKDQKYWVTGTLQYSTVLDSECCYIGPSTILPHPVLPSLTWDIGISLHKQEYRPPAFRAVHVSYLQVCIDRKLRRVSNMRFSSQALWTFIDCPLKKKLRIQQMMHVYLLLSVVCEDRWRNCLSISQEMDSVKEAPHGL